MKEKIKIYTRPMKAQKAGNNDSGSRRKKLMRFFGASSLAIIMGAGVLCGTILAPLATHTNTSAGDDPSLTAQEQLLAGTLELHPENDPVIYTTDYGLDIKWHMASPLPKDPNDLSTKGVSSTTWAYFVAGGLEWIIIGCSNKSTTLDNGVLNLANIASYYQKAGYYNFSNTGSGIWQYLYSNANAANLDAELIDIYANYGGYLYNQASNTISQKDVFPNAAATKELEINEVLCLLSGNYAFTSFGNKNVYYSAAGVSSNLRTYINDTIYPLVKDLPIEPQPLTTAGSAETTEYLFPLATTTRASTESFAVENYLNSSTKRDLGLGQSWWLRSGSYVDSAYASLVYMYGSVISNGNNAYAYLSYGVRPAFVLKI